MALHCITIIRRRGASTEVGLNSFAFENFCNKVSNGTAKLSLYRQQQQQHNLMARRLLLLLLRRRRLLLL
jgi:hypothetical protein